MSIGEQERRVEREGADGCAILVLPVRACYGNCAYAVLLAWAETQETQGIQRHQCGCSGVGQDGDPEIGDPE